jgi:hypothetical protein
MNSNWKTCNEWYFYSKRNVISNENDNWKNKQNKYDIGSWKFES